MKDQEVILNSNKLVQYLKKPASGFTRDDIINFIEGNGIRMLNFRYIAEDGKLKQLNFSINSRMHLEEILTIGERVDGSNLFSFIDAGSSDLYVIPRYKTAFVNPFAENPTLDILCSFYDNTGNPLESAPENILRKAHTEFKRSTGYTFKALGELEYYVITARDHLSNLYPIQDQKGYHEAPPFTKWCAFRKQALQYICECGGKVKYAHSEVGNFSNEYGSFEQNEIEFLPVDVEDAADQIVVAKWILRMLGRNNGVNISFAPKITIGKAGNGLHIHMLLEKNGVNVIADEKGLTDTAKKAIAGLLYLAAPLTAFGNTIPTSYLRLVPHQEAPTNICWGDRNRSVLVRVPLGWITESKMIADANPQDTSELHEIPGRQTFEFRAPDGSADVYLLLAGLVVAARHGLEMENALDLAKELYVDVNIFQKEHKAQLDKLEHLPISCWESADRLQEKREYFEKNGVFPAGTIDNVIKKLKSYHDIELSERLYRRQDEIKHLVDNYLHCM